jgi:hypothetical protein
MNVVSLRKSEPLKNILVKLFYFFIPILKSYILNSMAPILLVPKNKQISPLKFHLTYPLHSLVFQSNNMYGVIFLL